MHPYANPIGGNAKDQARCFDFITKVWAKPVHVIFSDCDEVFPARWGAQWAAQCQFGTFDMVPIPKDDKLFARLCAHFLQLSNYDEITALMKKYDSA